MSLTGTLLAGVSGLKAETNAMAIISDNIANLNTIGYKKSDSTFSTLVVNSAASTTYSPGGVISGRFALIDNQGTLQASNRPLDIAITGNGFFAVTDSVANGNQLYPRAGSFSQDAQGHLVNTNGMFLQGWALTQAGTIANVNQIQTVSVGTTNGVAVSTANVQIGANLNSAEANTGPDTMATFTGGTFAANQVALDSLANPNNTPVFRRAVQVFDALGTAHNLNMSFEKLANPANTWGFVLSANPPADVNEVGTPFATSTQGVVGYGVLTFNGDGSLASVTSGLSMATNTAAPYSAAQPLQPFYSGAAAGAASTGNPQAVPVIWANGAVGGDIKFNFGTPGAVGTGKTDGFSQFASSYNVAFINQDGSAVGLRTGVTIDKDGFVITSFSNGATQKIFQIPITTFADPNQLQAQNGDTFSQTNSSGSFNWRIANTGGAGQVAPSTLESSNSDLGDEFSSMIVTQRAYSANAKTITTADQMMQELLNVIQGG